MSCGYDPEEVVRFRLELHIPDSAPCQRTHNYRMTRYMQWLLGVIAGWPEAGVNRLALHEIGVPTYAGRRGRLDVEVALQRLRRAKYVRVEFGRVFVTEAGLALAEKYKPGVQEKSAQKTSRRTRST